VVNALVAVLALAFALRGRATGGRVAVGAFLFHGVYSLLWPGFVSFPDVTGALLQCGDVLQTQGLPMALLLAAGVRDLHATPGPLPLRAGAMPPEPA
jgi:hypothetical protein